MSLVGYGMCNYIKITKGLPQESKFSHLDPLDRILYDVYYRRGICKHSV